MALSSPVARAILAARCTSGPPLTASISTRLRSSWARLRSFSSVVLSRCRAISAPKARKSARSRAVPFRTRSTSALKYGPPVPRSASIFLRFSTSAALRLSCARLRASASPRSRKSRIALGSVLSSAFLATSRTSSSSSNSA